MQDRAPVTVAVTRFEDLVRAGLRALIEEDPNLEIVAENLEPDGLAEALHAHDPRVTILNFGTLSSAADVHRLHVACPRTRLLVLSNRPTPPESNQLLAFGATACLAKDVEARDILNAIHLASRGLHVLPRSGAVGASYSSGPEVLTAREADVLDHLRHGSSNAEIAAALCVSVETVRTHARAVFRKLGVRSRRELATPRG
jgi:DNA-binding NarL/FixJ family response regulator